MIFVVEGPDNAGKTTLAHRLAKALSGVYIKSEVKPNDTSFVQAFEAWTESAAMLFPAVILDRHHWISAPVYDHILRGRSRVDTFAATMACGALNVIYCRPRDSTISDFSPDISQLAGVQEHIGAIIKMYDQLFRGVSRGLFRTLKEYDYQQDSFDSILKHVMRVKEL